MNLYDENNLIALSRKLIQEKECWKDYAEWTHYNYEKLHDNILHNTGMDVSIVTLKRYFGKYEPRENYNPQIFTKDAVAKYLGYPDWESFRKLQVANRQPDRKKSSGKKIIIPFILLIPVMILLHIFLKSGITKKKATAYLYTSDSICYPGTIEFQYDISSIKSDSVFLLFEKAFYKDYPLSFNKKGEKKIINIFAPLSDFNIVKIIDLSGNVYAEFPVLIRSYQWRRELASKVLKPNGIAYVANVDNFSGYLQIFDEEIVQHKLNTYDWGYHTKYLYFDDFSEKIQNTHFKTRVFVKGPDDPAIYSTYIKVMLFGYYGNINYFIAEKKIMQRQASLSEIKISWDRNVITKTFVMKVPIPGMI